MANSPRPMGILRSLSLALMFLIGLTNCGYKLGYVKPAKFASVTTIYVPTFKNETLEPRSAVFAALPLGVAAQCALEDVIAIRQIKILAPAPAGSG